MDSEGTYSMMKLTRGILTLLIIPLYLQAMSDDKFEVISLSSEQHFITPAETLLIKSSPKITEDNFSRGCNCWASFTSFFKNNNYKYTTLQQRSSPVLMLRGFNMKPKDK